MVRRGPSVATAPTREPRKETESEGSKRAAALERGRAAVVAREVRLARGLAANSSSERARQLRRLVKWLRARSSSCFDFTEHDFMRLWKGLFYYVWMSDKPLVQEQLCEDIAKLFECFGEKNISTSILFYRCFLKTLATDWFGIDQHRLDKFLMLVRRVTRGILKCSKRLNWNKESTGLLETCLSGEGGIFSSTAPIEARMSLGLKLHLVDCWMEEIAKVSEGDISKKAVCRLVKPFAIYMSHGQENRLVSSIIKNIFIHLIRQTDHGIEYREKTHAWRNAGYPGGSVDAMQKVELSEDEDENDDDDDDDDQEDEKFEDQSPQKQALDPRAGHVDVELPQLPVDTESINKIFQELISDAKTSNASRNKMKDLVRKFETLGSGEYPFKMKEVMLPKNSKLKMPKVIPAAYDLIEFERTVGEDNDEEELKGLNKRQKRRFLMKQRKKYLLENDEEDDKPTTTIIKQKNKMLKSGSTKKILRKQTKNIIRNCSEFTVTDNLPKKAKENGIKDIPKPKKDKDIKPKVESKINSTTESVKKETPKPATVKNVQPVKPVRTKVEENKETEIIIPIKKKIEKKNKNNYLGTPNSKVIKGKITKQAKTKKGNFDKQKKVDIVLKENTHHTIVDYVRSVKSSPKIPFDSKKVPQKSSLKPNWMPSPISPFYKKKMNLS